MTTPIYPVTGVTKGVGGARAVIDGFLSSMGLPNLGDWAWNKLLDGSSAEEIMLELRARPEYKARFPYMEALTRQGRAISEAQAIEYERNAVQLMRAYGLPPGFYDQPSDFTEFMTNNVALPELENRLQLAQRAVFQADQETQRELQEFYGVTLGDMTAMFLDADRALPLLEQTYTAASISAAASRSDFGRLTQAVARELAALGVTDENAREGFSKLAGLRELNLTLPGEGEAGVTKDQMIGAAFRGSADDQLAVERVTRRREAAFEGGGGYTSSERGFTGVGTAR